MTLPSKYPGSESSRLEFKVEIPKYDQITKTAIAFCNTHGGLIVIGVADDGTLVGVAEEVVESTLESIELAILRASAPPIIAKAYLQRPTEEIALVCIEVGAGMNKPYYRKSEGKNKGTYVRVGRNTLRATPDLLQELEWRSRGISFEETPLYNATEQEFDNNSLEAFVSARRGGAPLALSHEMLDNYRLICKEQLDVFPTVCGVLLFGKRPQYFLPEAMIICSHFRGVEGRDSINTVDCEGTLLSQFEKAYSFLISRLGVAYSWDGPRRIDTLEVPEEALREGLLNAIAHRNYHIKAPLKVAIYDDRVEIYSPGSFPGPLVAADLPNGISYLRNPAICRVLREMGFLEKLGTGFLTIFRAMKERGLTAPQVIDGGDFIKLVLYRTAAKPEAAEPDEEKILTVLATRKELTISEVQELLKVSRSTAVRRLDAMLRKGLVKRVGKTRALRYVLGPKNNSLGG